MYGSVYELPPQVRNSLSPEDQLKFLEVYNGFNPKSEVETSEALRKTWHACSKLPSAFTFEIICGADDVDKDREIITVDSIKKNLDEFIKAGGPVQYEHGDYLIGHVYDWAPIQLDGGMDAVKVWGAIYGNNDVTREARNKFRKGLNSLSVAGEAELGKYSCEDGKCATRRNVKTLMEISLCTVPANRHCRMISSHEGSDAGFAKSGGYVNIPIKSMVINDQSAPLCPLRQLEKDLHEIGYTDAHATKAGVVIKMDNSSFAKAMPFIEKNRLHAVKYGDNVFLVQRDYMIEKSYKDGLKRGFINEDGTINGRITKSDFQILAEKNILSEENGVFRLVRE